MSIQMPVLRKTALRNIGFAPMRPRLLIFDFDGVIADSEVLACQVLARIVTEKGCPMSVSEAIDRFMGKRVTDVVATVEALVGRPLPGFRDELQKETIAVFEQNLHEVAGFSRFILNHASLARCIASSSALVRILACLRILGIRDIFGNHIFTSESVVRGKPFPDTFLHAAKEMRVRPEDALVIEDSPGGVEAAVAAGMRVIGLLAASHLAPKHENELRARGATFIARSYTEVGAILTSI